MPAAAEKYGDLNSLNTAQRDAKAARRVGLHCRRRSKRFYIMGALSPGDVRFGARAVLRQRSRHVRLPTGTHRQSGRFISAGHSQIQAFCMDV
jgi:hypothetical protein